MHGLTVVFDLDGTLVETAPDLLGATDHVLGLVGLPPADPALIRPQISFGARAMIAAGLRHAGRELPAAEVDDLHQRFLAHYAENIARHSHAYPGLEAALDQLAARGARLAVCTNKLEGLSRQLLGALGLIGRFQAVAGRDTFPVYKPDPGHLLGAIRLAGGDPRDAIMVGDSDTDIKTARAAGLPVIAVPFGYTDVPVEQLGPDLVLAHYRDLPAAIERVRSSSA